MFSRLSLCLQYTVQNAALQYYSMYDAGALLNLTDFLDLFIRLSRPNFVAFAGFAFTCISVCPRDAPLYIFRTKSESDVILADVAQPCPDQTRDMEHSRGGEGFGSMSGSERRRVKGVPRFALERVVLSHLLLPPCRVEDARAI